MTPKSYNIVVMGSGGVGKSALTIQFVRSVFVDEYDPTIEDSYRKTITVNGKPKILDVLDTAGQEEYNTLRPQYIRSGDGFLIVYSITDKQSFFDAKKLQSEILNTKDADPGTIPIYLVGNKKDLEDMRAVPTAEGQAFATESTIGFLEASAKTAEGVTEMFTELTNKIDEMSCKPKANHKPKPVGKKEQGCCTMM
ncbi:hypothetical protein SARC_11191 [Sphaeroforma arctica JP610]|uniref:small monomeric GTPase n=1 Tax=Sphaeroforma arctica JP610 TaxID=667725 RepID=A0A0L0FJU0_9EUKA|nr:hypothetical protein SARC_11191 [Sphaeroforma arctica JP610]KNC76298.1 hypothetical protein SARC_11191 [Sphaeroforma arctica JP610]|eukprot:XP_014150200.1 hypothetical protein SARC_11191 [Sphaeroforma arctica JP610]